MKVTLDWLNEFIDIDVSADVLAEKLTKSGFEVEEIIYQDKHLKNVVVGKILEIKKHPNAEKLDCCKVDIGNEIVQIITSAKNISVNNLVPVSLEGADLCNGIKIKKSVLRGEPSDGMFCSGEELGISDEYYEGASVNGILILKDEYKPGMPIADALGLNDIILDINLTSNRPDCMSILGIAKELSAILKKPLKQQDLTYSTDKNDDISNYLSVDVQDKVLCPRYMASAIKNIKIEKSPLWIRKRLNAVGIKSINNIVDITNYVLVEYGQPMHAFDYDYIEGKKIIVRRAENNEKIEVLNGNTYDLNNNILVICDAKKPVVIAGIIGGTNSCVCNETKTSIFEAACFERSSIRITGRNIGVRTDSTARFEKGVNTSLQHLGMKRALNLVYLLNAGTIVEGIIDNKVSELKSKVLNFDFNKINSILGIEIPTKDILEILSNLGFKPQIKDKTLTCEIPAERDDIERDADIAEELIRLYGYEVYDELDQKPLQNATYTVGSIEPIFKTQNYVRNILCQNGYYEALCFSLVPENINKMLNIKEDDSIYNMIKISNPLSEDIACVRTTMAHSLLNSLSFNTKRNNKNVKLFECGKVYLPKELPLKELPLEINMLSFVTNDNKDNFYTIKGVVENLINKYNLKYDLEYSTKSYLHPGKSADFIDVKTNKVFASIGQIHPVVAKNYDISENTFYGEVNLDYLISLKEKTFAIKPISKFPIVDRDLAVVVDESVKCDEILKSIKKSCGEIYYDVQLFDIYRSSILGDNKKSMAFNIKLSNNEKTLVEEEVTKVMDKILKDLDYKFGAKLR